MRITQHYPRLMRRALAIVVALISADVCLAAKGGNGGGIPGGGDPPPSIAHYEFQRIPMPADYSLGIPRARNINNHGELVGYYPTSDGEQPFFFDVTSEAAQLTNLNDVGLDPDFDVPTGWYMYAATDINNKGDIAGALARSDDPDQLQGFVLELRPDQGGLPRLHAIPDQAWSHTYASRINDAGQVLGRGDALESYIYQAPVHGSAGDVNVSILPMAFDAFYGYLNNPSGNSPAQVLTDDGKLFTLGDVVPTDLDLGVVRIDGFNDLGEISGSRSVATGKGKKTSEIGYIYNGQFLDLPSVQYAIDLNNSSDVVGDASTLSLILEHADFGTIDLGVDGVVLFDNDADRTLWNSVRRNAQLVSERGVAVADLAVVDFPVLVGHITADPDGSKFDKSLFILRPIPAGAARPSLSLAPEPSGSLLALVALLPLAWIRCTR